MSIPDDMATFVRVSEKGSFTAAAVDLSLTPSAVSKTISRLERRLGARLLTRTTRRLALTAEGETYLLRCREIIAAIEAAEGELATTGARPRGHIRVTTGTTIGRRQLAALVPEFLTAYPEVTIDLRISERRIDLVDSGVDVALRGGDLADSTLVARKLLETGRLICASPAYLAAHGTPTRPADLADHNCIVIADFPHLARWPFHAPEGVGRVHVRGNVTTDNADLMLDLALAGHGIVRMIDIHIGEAVRQGRLVPLLADAHADEPITIWAITPPGRNRTPRVRAFLDFLVERFGKTPAPITVTGDP